MLIDEIKKANFLALKEKRRNASGILSVIYSEYRNLEMERSFNNGTVSDVDLIAIIQKALRDLADAKINYAKVNNQERIEMLTEQEAVLRTFLPAMMTEDEIKAEIMKLDDRSIGNIMKHFKANHAGHCDMQLVNRIAKEL